MIVFAQLPQPVGEVILEVSGNIKVKNTDESAEFDRDMIAEFKTHEITTTNHIASKPTVYKGFRLTDLIERVKGVGKVVRVYALDDYLAELSYADIKKYKVILATHENGRQLTIEDRGPFFVVFPFSDHPEIQHDSYYNQSVWQIKAVEIE